MSFSENSLRVAIAGASSLRGQDLKQWLEESGFPAVDVRLFDEELVAGTLTDLAGEAGVIQPIDEDSFRGLRFVFFTGSPAFARLHGLAAARAGATVIDLSGALSGIPGSRRWIPRLDAVFAPPEALKGAGAPSPIFISPSAPAIVACSFSSTLREFKPARLVMIFFQPVSERGRAGVEELEGQMVKLLSLQSIPQEVFDCQVAFNMLDRWGAESRERLADAREALGQEVQTYLAGRAPVPAMMMVQAPVFYGYAFAAYAEFAAAPDPSALAGRLERAGFRCAEGEEPGPSNVGVAGEQHAVITRAVRDTGCQQGFWFWGAADNLRLATANATQIAERILVS